METTASVRGVRLSAQKGRLVADLVRGKPVDKALNILSFTQKKAAGLIKKAIESAIACEHNDGGIFASFVSRGSIRQDVVAALRTRPKARYSDPKSPSTFFDGRDFKQNRKSRAPM